MFSYAISLFTGAFAMLMAGTMVFSGQEFQDLDIALLALLFAASAVFRGLALWERSQDDRSSK